MGERPIIFSAPMVRALLAGRKTQTRRILSTRNTLRDGFAWSRHAPWADHDWNDAFVDPGPSPAGNPGPYLKAAYPPNDTRHRIYPLCWPGDRLWVREAWRAPSMNDGVPPSSLPVGCARQFEADGAGAVPNPIGAEGKLRSPIHMPRWASRLTLTLTDVRVERLQDISEVDAIAEGAMLVDLPAHGPATERGKPPTGAGPRQRFQTLWNSLHGPDAWAANPWVVALTFTADPRNIDASPAPGVVPCPAGVEGRVG